MRLIDADGLKERLKEYCVDGDKDIEKYYEIMGIDECVDETPTIDAVEVVRCKDCKEYKYCFLLPNDDDYCSKGERKEK